MNIIVHRALSLIVLSLTRPKNGGELPVGRMPRVTPPPSSPPRPRAWRRGERALPSQFSCVNFAQLTLMMMMLAHPQMMMMFITESARDSKARRQGDGEDVRLDEEAG